MAVSRFLPRALALFFCFFAAPFALAQPGESGPTPLGLIVQSPSANDRRFFFCTGITKPDQLDAYVAAGFNTLVVPVGWRFADQGNSDFASERSLAGEAAKRGLKVIFALPAAPSDAPTRVSADSPSYAAVWTNWAQTTIAALADTPSLVGWMLPDDARALVSFDDASFRRYLQSHFPSVDALNARWNTRFDGFDSVVVDDVVALVSARKGAASPGAYGGAPLPALGSDAAPSQSADFHPAALFLADWKRGAWRDAMSLWASVVRGADDKRLVFSGACPDYAQLLAMPDGVDVAVSSVMPTVAENDLASNNPQALDLARHGGTRAALARFALAGNEALGPDALAQLLPRWTEAALAHGSRGVAFSDFDVLNRNPGLFVVVQALLKRVKAEGDDADAPVASFAVLLDGLSDGSTASLGALPLARGLYGFGDGLVEGEPSSLVASLRWGTAFGGADFLTPDDLARVDLSRYSVILAPSLLDCAPPTAQALGNYVKGGGVLVADLGLGALQNGGSMTTLPPSLALLAGGVGPFSLQNATFNLRGAAQSPLLPTWSKQLDVRPGMVISSGDGRDGCAFDGPTGFAPQAASAIVLATGSSNGRARALLSQANVGRGAFLFAPFRLWAHWRPGDEGFDGLFGDLLARGANLAVPSDALTPFPVATPLGQTRFPEVVNRPQSLSFLNHSAPGTGNLNLGIETTGTGDWVWSNAFTRLSNSSQTPLGVARPAPVGAPFEGEARARPLSIYISASPGQRVVSRQSPVSLQNRAGGNATGQLWAQSAKALSLNVWGETLQIGVPMGASVWQPIALDGSSPFRVSVVDSPDGYRCPPGSRHRVSIREFGVPDPPQKSGVTTFQTLVADRSGRLVFDFSGGACAVSLSPEAAPRP